MTEPAPRKSDLGIRVVSAVVLLLVSGATFFLGGWFWTAFVGAAALVVGIEWIGLTLALDEPWWRRIGWAIFGAAYIGNAAYMLPRLREAGVEFTLAIVLAVIATDVGAYFTGRHFGGPKIAPNVSPSKTWSGLAGGIFGAAVVWVTYYYLEHAKEVAEFEQYVRENGTATDWSFRGWRWGEGILMGVGIAIIAQAGDFLESWMKRRAGVKDSGKLIPGHGGLFDRLDGLLAVIVVTSIWMLGVVGA